MQLSYSRSRCFALNGFFRFPTSRFALGCFDAMSAHLDMVYDIDSCWGKVHTDRVFDGFKGNPHVLYMKAFFAPRANDYKKLRMDPTDGRGKRLFTFPKEIGH